MNKLPGHSRTHRKTLAACSLICLAAIGLGGSRKHPETPPTPCAAYVVSVHYIPSGSPVYTPRPDHGACGAS